MKKLILFLFVLCTSISVSAQTSISGTVISGTDNSGLPGVSVSVKGTTLGTATDGDGNFSITVPTDKAVLIFKYLGFTEQQVPVSGDTRNLRVVMKEDTQLLDEVVVVGYGTMKKRDISGSSITVGEDKLKGSVITNLDQALQGRAAGVNSVMTSGAPGSSVSIRIRGISTLNADAEPLYVIDGVIVQKSLAKGSDLGLGGALGNGSVTTVSPLASINPSDIVSMEILKDASATAIYGSLGSNGVVLITTKHGKAGEAKFSYDGYMGVDNQSKRLKMMNLREYAEFAGSVAEQYGASPGSDYTEYGDPSLLGRGTNWQDAIFRQALIQNHQISAQGGNDNVRYYVSGNYMGQEGTIVGTDFKRYSVRVNLDADMKSWLKLGVNAMYSSTKDKLISANGSEGLLTDALLTPPDIPIYDIDGNYATEVRENYRLTNPIAMALINDISLNRNKLNGSIFLDVKPIRNLVWHSELGFDFSNSKGNTFNPTYSFGVTSKTINELRISKDNTSFYQVINNLTYSEVIKKHSFTVMVGEDLWESQYNNLEGYGTGLPSNEIQSLSLSDPASQSVTTGFGSTTMVSILARATYNYDDRYLGTFTYRRDSSSNFGPENRWANFKSFALSWRFSNEAFLKSDHSVLSNGKLRFGWGQTGNANIDSYRWGASISKMPTALGVGYRQGNIANPFVHWETQKQWNYGLDLGFFRDRINLVIDAYDKTSGDMLMHLDLPSYMGTKGNSSSALDAPWGNYGTINNKGLEISLNTINLKGAFEWQTDVQVSFNKNKLVSLMPGTPPLMGYPQWDGMGSPITRTQVGDPLYKFYGWVTDGYYKDKADIENSPKPKTYPADGTTFNQYNTVWVGDIKFKDLSGPDGKPDGVIDDYDRTDLGSPYPKVSFGMNNTFRYKNFDLSLFINGTYGNKVYNQTAVDLSAMNGAYQNQLRIVTDRARLEAINPGKIYDGTGGIWNWYQDIDNVRLANNPSQPRALNNGDPNENARNSDRYIENGSYLRIKNIIFGYTVPAKLTHKFFVDNIRVYANIQNLCTFTKYTGYDPEIGVSTMSPNVYGMDYGRYPSPQSYTFGLNISF
ncbi:MAG: TonB-dependent receptor [Candidatus Azobacteroides sp.]|nr:TonB-dependent receptor [Candidatus Azobacteroides sp.]